MPRPRRLSTASLRLAGALALAVAMMPALLAQRTATQAVVTAADPIWADGQSPRAQAQEPAAPDAPAGGRGQGSGTSGPPQPRDYAQVICSGASSRTAS